MKTISPTELNLLLSDQPKLIVVDVRTPMEYEEIHLQHGRNEPLSGIQPQALADAGILKKEQPVYLLCRSGSRAEAAAKIFFQHGFSTPIIVQGGILAWNQANLPVIRGPLKRMSLERQVRIVAGSLVLIGILLSHFVHHYFLGISIFVGTGLIFAGITDWCGMGLFLAKLPWNQVHTSRG